MGSVSNLDYLGRTMCPRPQSFHTAIRLLMLPATGARTEPRIEGALMPEEGRR